MDNTENNSSALLRFAGDINIEYITITSLVSGRILNVTNQVLTIQIYEDLFSHFMSGSLILRESLDLTNFFPFVGEEVVDIRIFTPTYDKLEDKRGVIEGQFYIYKMDNREELGESNVAYQLHFISMEAFVDMNTKLSKSYSGKISDIVVELLKDSNALRTMKDITIEETANTTKYISNYWSPIRNITFLLENAINSQKSPTYVFFENRNGFNFVSLDTLNAGEWSQHFKYSNIQDDVLSTGSSTRVLDTAYKNIIELRVPTTHDLMDKVNAGTYSSTIIAYDLTTKKYSKQYFSCFEDWGVDNKEYRLNMHPIASTNVWATNESAIFLDSKSTGLFNNYGDVSNTKIIQKRISRLKQSEAFKIEIVVPGRTDYTVGMVVSVEVFKSEPVFESDTWADNIDRVISGAYLITSINHVIDRNQYQCCMELCKDSLNINLENGGR